jgi:hypothetical protein
MLDMIVRADLMLMAIARVMIALHRIHPHRHY